MKDLIKKNLDIYFLINKTSNHYKKFLASVFTLIIVFSFAKTHSLKISLNHKKNNSFVILYVKPVGSGTQDGSSWENASSDIQSMINSASPNTQIWISAGTYKPNRPANNLNIISPNNRDNAFVMKNDVSLYGGFSGVETETSQRDIISNPTILSGDFNDNDIITGSGKTLNIINNYENSYHIIINVGTSTTLDGLRITRGNSNGLSTLSVDNKSIYRNYGGGIYNINGSLTLENVNTSENSSQTLGGGIYNADNGNIKFKNCIVSKNYNMEVRGGGIYNTTGNIEILNTDIFGNSARNNSGGGIYSNFGSLSLINSKVRGNYVNSNGSGINNNYGTVMLRNSILNDNIADGFGGGMFSIQDNNDSQNVILTNCTVSGNLGQSGHGGIFGLFTLKNSIVWSNSTDEGIGGIQDTPYIQQNSIVQSVNNINNGNFDGTDQSIIVFKDVTNNDYSLATNSPLINAGSNNFYIEVGGDLIIDKDIAGNQRLKGDNIDIGAYEFTETMNVLDTSKNNTYTYPNPFSDNLKISNIKNIKQITLTDMSGSFIKNLPSSKEINLSYLRNGLYIITIYFYDGSIKSFKIIKK